MISHVFWHVQNNHRLKKIRKTQMISTKWIVDDICSFEASPKWHKIELLFDLYICHAAVAIASDRERELCTLPECNRNEKDRRRKYVKHILYSRSYTFAIRHCRQPMAINWWSRCIHFFDSNGFGVRTDRSLSLSTVYALPTHTYTHILSVVALEATTLLLDALIFSCVVRASQE